MPVVAILVGCKGGKSKSECQTETADLVQWLKAIPRSPMFPRDIHPATRKDLARAPYMEREVILIGANAIHYRGQMVADARDLGDRLRPSPDHAIYFAIDRDAAWGVVASVAAVTAEHGLDHVSVLYELPDVAPATPPPRSKVDDALDKLGSADSSDVAMEISRHMREIIKPCAGLDRAFSRVGADEGDKLAYLIAATGETLPECGCDIDIPAFRSVMWRVVYSPTAVGAVPLVLARDGTPVEAPVTAHWSEIGDKLAPGAKVWLVAK
jgi:hypothetical protein